MPFFQPSDITGIFCWWRAHDISLGPNSGVVCYWQDASGSGNHLSVQDFIQPSALACPWWVPNQINGYPSIRFNGSTNVLAATGNYNGTSYYFSSLAPSSLTSFIVYNTKSSTTVQTIFSNDNIDADHPAKNNFILNINNTVSGWSFAYGKDAGLGINVVSSVGLTVPENTWLLRSDRWRTTDNAFCWARNGTILSSGYSLNMSSDIHNQLKVGANDWNGFPANFFNGDIAEIVAYDRRINEVEVDQVTQYLVQKYLIGGAGGFPLFIYAEANSGIYSNFPLVVNATPSVSSGISLFELNSSSSSGHIPLFVGSTTVINSGKPLYIGSSTIANSSISLYEYSLGSGNANFPLYIGNSQSLSSGCNLYTYGKDTSSGAFTLYMQPTLGNTSEISLYIGASLTGVNSFPLYIGNSIPINSGFDLYVPGSFINNSGLNLYLIGGLERGHFPLYMPTYDSGNKSLSLFIGASLNSNSSIPLYIAPFGNESGFMPLTIYSAPPQSFSGGFPLVMTSPNTAGTSGLYQAAPLYISSFGNSANMPLFISTDPFVGSGTNSSKMPLFIFGPQTSGVINHSVPLFLSNNVQIANANRLKMYVRGDGQLDGGLVGNANMPLFISRLPGNSMTLFIGNQMVTSGVSLYMPGAFISSQGVSLITTGMGFGSGNSLYISGPGFLSHNVGLTISGQPLQSNQITMYEHGF